MKQKIFFLLFIVSLCLQGKIPKSFFAKFLPKNPIIVEAGINEGEDTQEMARLWPNGTIFGFEPISTAYDKAQKRLSNYKNVKIFNLALSSYSGIAEMYVSEQKNGQSWDLSSSLLQPTGHLVSFSNIVFPRKINVNTVTLDDWAAEHNVENVDFLWFDMQGAECDVLMNSPKILSTVKAIYTEVSLKEMYKGQKLYSEYKNFLQQCGFNEVYEEYPLGIHGNVLFVRSNNIKTTIYR